MHAVDRQEVARFARARSRWPRLALVAALGVGSLEACADDAGDAAGADGGGGEMSGTGGEGGVRPAPSDTCEAFCGTSCPDISGISLLIFNFTDCVIQCRETPFGNDGCGREAEAFVRCLESVDCDEPRFIVECPLEQANLGRCTSDGATFED